MKKLFLLILPTLLFITCQSDDDMPPQTESITNGAKWNLQIGSPAMDLYKQLQKLGIEKNFEYIGLPDRKPYLWSEEILSDLNLYGGFTLERSKGNNDRVLIQCYQGIISSIITDSIVLKVVQKWPKDLPLNATFNRADSTNNLNKKVSTMYQFPKYQDYNILLADKLLSKPYDSLMASYDQWTFKFYKHITPSRIGQSSVILYLEEGKLVRIRHDYNESDLVAN